MLVLALSFSETVAGKLATGQTPPPEKAAIVETVFPTKQPVNAILAARTALTILRIDFLKIIPPLFS
jgi:hypothetical protein